MYDTVRWGPTLMNTSPLRLLLVRSPEARERLASHMGETTASGCARRRWRSWSPRTWTSTTTSTPWCRTCPGARDRFADAATRARIARDQAWLQAGYLIVGLRAEGLDVGPMSGMDAAAIDADLLAGTSWRSLMVLNVGYPAAEPAAHPRAPRLEFDDAARVA